MAKTISRPDLDFLPGEWYLSQRPPQKQKINKVRRPVKSEWRYRARPKKLAHFKRPDKSP